MKRYWIASLESNILRLYFHPQDFTKGKKVLRSSHNGLYNEFFLSLRKKQNKKQNKNRKEKKRKEKKTKTKTTTTTTTTLKRLYKTCGQYIRTFFGNV